MQGTHGMSFSRSVGKVGMLCRAGLSVLPALVALGACRPSAPMETTPSGLGAARDIAEETLTATLPKGPVRMSFRFSVREADFRFQGRGVARVEPPYRVRIDLFSNGGETLFMAALVGEDLRVPPWAPKELAPPPGLLWAALGVFRPDPGWELTGVRSEGDGSVVLGYQAAGDEELRFRILERTLVRAELYREGHLTEEVDLTPDPTSGSVVETVYRNLAEFLEMTFALDSAEAVASFPPAIWDPGK